MGFGWVLGRKMHILDDHIFPAVSFYTDRHGNKAENNEKRENMMKRVQFYVIRAHIVCCIKKNRLQFRILRWNNEGQR